MPFEIVRNDITNMQVDVIVNTANPDPVIGYGVDAGIHQKAGPELLAARQKIGRIRVGDAAVTSAFGLSARYVIHAVAPVWQGGGQNEEHLLQACYEKSLKLAKRYRCHSIAFPLMSAGNHGFPKPLALQTAMNAISNFLLKNEMQVYLVVFSRDAFQLSEKLFSGVSSFIDENYILQKNMEQYGVSDKCIVRENQQQLVLEAQRRRMEAARQSLSSRPLPPVPSAPIRQDTPSEWDEVASICPDEEPRFSIRERPLPSYGDAAPARSSGQHPSPARTKSTRPSKSPGKSSFLFPFQREKLSLADLLKQTDAGFSETLIKLIDQTGKKDSEIYSKANVSRQHFSKIRNNPGYKPTKPTAIAFAIALELNLEQTQDLIGRAGYALTMSSKFDVIIMYFISHRNYNMCDINAALFEFDQSLLGA